MRSVLVSPEALERRRTEIAAAPGLLALKARLGAGLAEFVARPLYVPDQKALLSRWGSTCRDDGAELAFDPWSPEAQRCTRCGRIWATEQTHRWWVYWYQLWLAERCWQSALLAVLDGDARFEARALETLAALAGRYLEYPNADNVLGPSRPFFSTYLESVWVLQLAAAASLLGEHGRLPADLERDLASRLFRPSAETIADFEERRSNRQVWNAAALLALGTVLDDAALREGAARGPAGVLATLDDGLLGDGLWYEGENYHWFALRGLAWGAEMLRTAGELDLWSSGTDDRPQVPRGVPRAGADGAARLHLSRSPRFPVRGLAPPAAHGGAVGAVARPRAVRRAWRRCSVTCTTPRCRCVEDGAGLITEVERQEPSSGVRRAGARVEGAAVDGARAAA